MTSGRHGAFERSSFSEPVAQSRLLKIRAYIKKLSFILLMKKSFFVNKKNKIIFATVAALEDIYP